MGRPPQLASILLGCLLVLGVNAKEQRKCTVGCHGMHGGKGYQEGHTYIYDLEGTSVTSVADAQGEATLKLKATVELSAKPDCIRQLRLKGVQVNGAPISLPDVEQKPIQFNYHDGHIDTELCTTPGDSQASLNIKRAVISLFQAAIMQDSGSTTHHETDIFGSCPTDFSFHKEGDSTIVQKYRDLSRCSHRENIKQGLLTAALDNEAGMKSSPLLGSNQKIEQRFKKGILNKAVSTETYKFKPFSNGDSGAKTVVETTLVFKSESGDIPAAEVSQPKSLVFEVPHPVVKSSTDAISNALKAVKSEHGTVKADAASKFADLVKVLRTSSKNDILSVYHKVRAGAGFDKNSDKKILLDALFRAGSGEAAEVAVELIKNREIAGVQALLFYTSLALVQHVNLPAVTAVTSLLDQPELPRIGYLGIGQVIGRYCQQHSCDDVPEVKEAIKKIRDKIGNGKTKSRHQENVIVSALKALGNAKYLDDATLQKLANIAADKNVKNRVRVAAIEALPSRCSLKWKNIMFKVLADREEDSEIRIKTYLSLVACACPHVANQVKEVLDKETINQVGSFITTHLRNLRASTDPSKQEAKKQLGLIKPRTKFPEDFRKFSFNNELSYYLDAYGVGSTVETNVIYSQNSFVPRSANLNMSTEIFGHMFNFLELDTRVENLDRVLEHYFGPKGEVSEYEVKDIFDEGTETAKKLKTRVHERMDKLMRHKREVKQAELDKFAKNVHLRNTEVDQDLDIDMSMKLFGVELAYLSYQGDAGKLSPSNMIDKVFDNIEKGLGMLKNFNYDVENHLHFLDTELVYPSGIGAPLSLGITGTSVVNVKANGKIDFDKIFSDPKNAAFTVGLQPSASISITGNLMQDMCGVESGMKVITTLHTSTGSNMNVKLLNGKGIDVSFDIPKKKQELISVSSEVLMTSGPKGEKLVSPKFSKGREHTDCFEQFSGLLGITVCGQVSFPYENIESVQKKPLFPLSGPAKFSVTLENNDINTVQFKVFYDDSQAHTRSLEILLDTPNSRTNRRVSLLLAAGLEPDKFAKISFDSPVKKASIEGRLKNRPEEKSLTITLENDQIKYYLRGGILAEGSKYKPVLEYHVPEHIEKLAGVKTGTQSQQHNVLGTVEVLDVNSGKKYVFDKVALMVSGRKIVGLDGSLTLAPDQVGTDMKVELGEENVALKLDAQRLGEKNYKLSLSAVPSRDPNVGFNLKWEYKRDPQGLKNKLVFVHGPPDSQTNRFTVDQELHHDITHEKLELSGSSKISYPALQLVLDLDGKLTRDSIKGEIDVKYEKFKLGAELSAKRDMKTKGDYEVELEAEVLENSLELKSKRTVLAPHKSKFENSLEMKPGGKYKADGVVTYDVSKENMNMQLDGRLDLNGKVVKVDTGLESNRQKLNSHAHVTVGSTKYVEFILTGQKEPHPKGEIRMNLKNYIMANGQFKYQNGKGDGNIDIDIPKLNRKIKAAGDVTVVGTQHNGNFELLYDADKDPSKRIKVSTNTDISKTSMDSKNVIEILNQKLEANGRYNVIGEFDDGQLNLDFDVTLPNGRQIIYSGKRTAKKKGDKMDIQVQVDIMDRMKGSSQANKCTYNANVQDFDRKLMTMKGRAQIKCTSMDGKDLQGIINYKHDHEGTDKKIYEIDADYTGSVLYRPMKLQVSVDHDKTTANYKGYGSLGDNLSAKVEGLLDIGEISSKRPMRDQGTIELKLPYEKLHTLKLDYGETLLAPQETGLFNYDIYMNIIANNEKKIKMSLGLDHKEMDENMEKCEGSAKVGLEILEFPPLNIDGSYKYDATGEIKKGSSNLNVDCGGKKSSLAIDSAYNLDFSDIKLNAKGATPYEKLRNVDLQFEHMREGNDHYKTNVNAAINEDKYSLVSEGRRSPTSPMVHIVINCPQGKTELLSQFQKLGDREYKGEWKLVTMKGFVEADAHVNLESVDNFVINVNFDSDKISQRKIHAEIANRPTAKTGRRIVITVTSDGKNIVTGSTNYKKRDEDGKIVVEGNGNLKIGENTRSSSFKYTRQELTRERDGEVGVAMVLHANFEPSAIVGELKLTNKEMHVFNSYCEQNKDCAHFKLQSILDTDQKTYMKHEMTVEVDLRKFNVPAASGSKSSTEYRDMYLDHSASLYMHSSKGKSQYSYRLHLEPHESFATLELPTRELASILTVNVPKTKQTGAFKVEGSVYLDRKNRPNEKTSLLVGGDVHADKNSLSVNGEAKFMYPNQPKDMLVKGRLHCGGEHMEANMDIDVFSKKTQKITIVAKAARQQLQPQGYNMTGIVEITSRGQQLKVDLQTHLAVAPKELGFGSIFSYTDEHQKPKSTGILFSLNDKEGHLIVTSPNKEIIRSDVKIEVSKNLQKFENDFSMFGEPPIITSLEIRDANTLKFQQYSTANPGNKLTANGHVVIGQLAQADVDWYQNNAKKNLVHVLVHLDEGKFLKPEFGYEKDNIIAVIEKIKERMANLGKQMKDVSLDIGEEIRSEFKDLIEHLKKAQPNWKPLLDYYQGELNKLKEELHADETIKEIQATLNKQFGNIIAAVTETMKLIAERLKGLSKQYEDILTKITDAANAAYPQLKESFEKIFNAGAQVANAVGNLTVTYLKSILNLINEHQKEIKEVIAIVSEFLHDVAKLMMRTYGQIKKDTEEFVQMLVNQAKALPVYDTLKEKYKELASLQIPDTIIRPIEDICLAIKNMMPTEELRDFFSTTSDYIMKLAKRQKVDDAAEIKKIYQSALTAIRSLISLLESKGTLDHLPDMFDAQLPTDLDFWIRLPGLSNVKLSIWNLLRNRELPSPLDVYYAYKPTRYLTDIIPPFSKSGIVTDGGHIFTFDGRHLTLAGSCSYILAQDMRDGNFSVVATFDDSHLTSITVTEPKESITLKADGKILVNNKPADFPASTKNLHAYIVGPILFVKSDYGVRVKCGDNNGPLCSIRISGFYLGKVRGLLGDGNNEPYDDFTLPSGKITENAMEFGKAYALKPDCPITAVDYKTPQREAKCTEYFSSSSSPMSNCFKYVNPSHYRDACDYNVKSGRSPCVVATAYYAACLQQLVFGVSIPPVCNQCEVGTQKIEIGDSFGVQIPKKQADIVFVVEQETKNEKVFKELVLPLMAELREELKHHGITDVHVGLIGFGENMEYPQHYTVNGNTNIEGEVKNMKFEEKEPVITLEQAKDGGDAEKKLKYLEQRLNIELGTMELTDAYEEAINYPFRPGAAKAVIGVLGSPCEKSLFPISVQQLRLILAQKIYHDLGLTYYHVSYPGDILINGKHQKNIVGYDRESVFTLADSKKRPISGANSELRDKLVRLQSDVCADFAVRSGGATFNSDTFVDAKPNQKKQFNAITARRIVEGLLSVELEEDCTCKQYDGTFARANCKIVDRKEKQIARHTKDQGVKG